MFDLYQDETSENIDSLPPVSKPEVGAFDNFFSGTAKYTMQGFAKAGRAIDILGSVGPIIQDVLASDRAHKVTEAQDRYFQEHEEVFGRAVDYWTPTPGEVGVAAEVTGQLLSVLPQVIMSPALAVATTQLSVAEDLIEQGIDPAKAQAVGAVQAAGLGLGIWMPILGQTGWQRVVVGGAGFNVAQGAAMRGVSGEILEGTEAAEGFKAFDGTALTLDVLLGAAFGGIAHLSPAQRAQGAETWKRIEEFAGKLKPSEIAALATLRQAQHVNVDSAPGKPTDLQDIDAHVQRVRTAIDQLAQDKPVDVSDLPEPRFETDESRIAESKKNVEYLQEQAENVSIETGLDDLIRGSDDQTIVESRPDKDTAEELYSIVGGGRPAQGWTGATSIRGTTGELTPVYRGASADLDATHFGFENLGKASGNPSSGLGVWFAIDASDASRYGKVSEYYLDIRNPKVIPVDELPAFSSTDEAYKFRQSLQEQGHDGIGIDARHLGGTFHIVAFDPHQVIPNSAAKSAKTEAPSVGIWDLSETEPQPVEAKPPPPPGEAEAAGTSATDPLAMESRQFVDANPDIPITIGRNADGSPQVVSAKAFLDDADSIVKRANEDAKLFEIAAGCLLGAA